MFENSQKPCGTLACGELDTSARITIAARPTLQRERPEAAGGTVRNRPRGADS
jgi:hypothetical protein